MKRHPVAAFYILAFAISWSGYFPQVAYSYGLFPFQSPLYFLIGGVGPTLAAVIMAYVLHGKGGLRGLFAPLARWRVGAVWYAVALFGNAVIWLAAIGLPGRTTLDMGKLGPWFTLFPVFLTNLLMNVWEEIGWRGFALPRLQSRYTALVSSLIVGALWGLWHLPLLLMKDYPMSTYPRIPWFIGLIASAVLYTWLYNNTNGSLLIATVFHAAGNTTGYFVESGLHTIQSFIFDQAVIACLIAAIIVAVFGPVHLSRSGKRIQLQP